MFGRQTERPGNNQIIGGVRGTECFYNMTLIMLRVESWNKSFGSNHVLRDISVTVQPGEYRSFTLKLAADADHHTSLTYDPYTSELTLDRSYAGSRADIVHRRSCKVRSQNGALDLLIVHDQQRMQNDLFIIFTA